MYGLCPSALAAALLLVYQACIASAQSDSSTNSTCNPDTDRDFNTRPANATGSYTGPGYSPANTNSNISLTTDWIWNTTVSVSDDNQVYQSFSIDTPNLKGVEDSDVPFQVCAIALTGLPRSTYIKGQQDNGDCSQTLNTDCANALRNLAAQSVGSGDSGCANIMSQIAQKTPQDCQSFGNFGDAASTTNRLTSALFSKSGTDGNSDEESTSCPSETDNTAHPLFSFSNTPFDSTTFNEAEYDEATYRVIPFLTTVVSNDTQRSGGGFPSLSSQTSLLCMRAKDITPGSRSPPALQDTTATTTAAPGPSPTPDQNDPPTSVASRGLTLSLHTFGPLGLALAAWAMF
ncbi:MAG: hypothetical protein Q9222_001137 [Ikaeria aurantiellina]